MDKELNSDAEAMDIAKKLMDEIAMDIAKGDVNDAHKEIGAAFENFTEQNALDNSKHEHQEGQQNERTFDQEGTSLALKAAGRTAQPIKVGNSDEQHPKITPSTVKEALKKSFRAAVNAVRLPDVDINAALSGATTQEPMDNVAKMEDIASKMDEEVSK